MATHLRVNVITLWLVLALSALSICRAAVGDIATQDFFNGILSAANTDGCPGKTFYTYADFINAANAFSSFGTNGTPDDQKREIAAFFANVAHETGSLCKIDQTEQSDYCNPSYTKYPCAGGKQYYGRGPLQLSWNYNYGPAGDYLRVNLLKNPETVAQDDSISWKTALWFWNVNTGAVGTTCHAAITSGQGFGKTIQIINGGVECSGKMPDKVKDRMTRYTEYCKELGVERGDNLSC